MAIERLLVGSQNRSPEKNMSMLLEILSPPLLVPEDNKYYTFVYKAKTPNIQYDQHPFILCSGVYQWGFTGYNLHLDSPRRYTWGEVRTNIFEIPESEVESMQSYPTTRIKTS